ncbi:MAG: glycoside hydrolase family 78 protein [Bacilli bacterium]|nr:glycoside hydrolase family 78 protein [Bacilli bacterium]
MLKIASFLVEGKTSGAVTDATRPHFSFYLTSDKEGSSLKSAKAIFDSGYELDLPDELGKDYDGPSLLPFKRYEVVLKVEDNLGESAEDTLVFETGRLGKPWLGKFITDGEYTFTEKKVSPKPMVFKKDLKIRKKVRSARIFATCFGIYELDLNGEKVGNRYFAPGFTSYANQLMYQVYDIGDKLKEDNEIVFHVGGGWAVGSFVFSRVNRHYADKQSLLCEIRIEYEDGTSEVIGSDESFLVSTKGPYSMEDIYDGEDFDASIEIKDIPFHNAVFAKNKLNPTLLADYGAPVVDHETLTPISKNVLEDGTIVYDFGQNFAGVVEAHILKAEKGRKISFRHAEVTKKDGSLNTDLLRTARAGVDYICKEGEQFYVPRMSYMGFRYIGVSGIKEEDIEIKARVRYSDMELTGGFECSDSRVNRLQQNIIWSSKSNFVEIPTDCPQRDERMGWTGDIALFANTACWNFDTQVFLRKWLKDLRSEQLRTGGVPNCIPIHGYGFPVTMPKMAIDFWGDASVLVPYALYNHYGDKKTLEVSYESMRKYTLAEKFWAGLIGLGKRRYIWQTPAIFHFGDWVAPDEPTMAGWQKRSKYTGTCSLSNMAGLVSFAADLLGKEEDKEKFAKIREKTNEAYRSVFFHDDMSMKEKPFQTAYVLPLRFGMFEEEEANKAAEKLAELVKSGDYCIGTGFPGTPNILFALADNGQRDTAYKMLLNDKCPSWLHEVKMGGTTIWERFDAIRDGGDSNTGADDGTGGMISFNHYASGAVGEFLYARVLGIEWTLPGYKKFKFAPLLGEGIDYAKGHTLTPYGQIKASWKKEGESVSYEIDVPVSCTCLVCIKGQEIALSSGHHQGRVD